MKKPKILVVGSFVMDQIALTDKVPHEGETVLGKSFSKAPGGKGANQAVQAARLGAQVTMVGKLGRDANGRDMIEVLEGDGIDVSHVAYDDKLSSGCSVIILQKQADGAVHNRIIVLPGTNMAITERDVSFLKETIGDYDLVMLQLEIPMEINELVAAWAYEKGVPVMLNSAPSAPLSDSLLSHLAYISPNEHEAADLTGITIEHEGAVFNKEQAIAVCTALRAKGVKNVLVTMGSAGAVLMNDEGFFHSPALQGVTVVDPTAAGDSFVGAFCTGIACGWKVEETMAFANQVASRTVSAAGAMPSLPTLGAVERFIEEKGFRKPDFSRLR